jgi:hypothetical protein
MLSRCETCQGKKQITALGAMKRACPACKGIGFIKINEVVPAPKHAGRPKKVEG